MLLRAITQSIHRAFPDIPVYAERVVQGMKYPCFSVLVISASQRELIGNRYPATWLVIVRFFPSDDGSESSYAALHEIAQTLYGVMDEVRYQAEGEEDDVYFGIRMGHYIEENVLQFQATYNFWLKKVLPEVTVMQELEITVKAGEQV